LKTGVPTNTQKAGSGGPLRQPKGSQPGTGLGGHAQPPGAEEDEGGGGGGGVDEEAG